jgi:hypothetical protein
MRGAEFERAIWVEARIRELPRTCVFLWNLLLDRNLPDRWQEDVFAALVYVLEGGDLVVSDDPALRGVDELAFAFACLEELLRHLPPATLAPHEEGLLRGGILIRDQTRQAPAALGGLLDATRARYQSVVAAIAPWARSASRRNNLYRILHGFVDGFRPPAWAADRLARMQLFLDGNAAAARR